MKNSKSKIIWFFTDVLILSLVVTLLFSSSLILMLPPFLFWVRVLILLILIIITSVVVCILNKKTIKFFLLGYSIIVLLPIVFCLWRLLNNYYVNNREAIEMCSKEYPGVFSVIDNDSNSLELYVNNYYVNEGLKITDVSFTPNDCLLIVDKINNKDTGFVLSFVFPNGAIIKFCNNDGEFNEVVLDNSNTRGFIVPNLAYYKNYSHFDRYYIYGAMNDLPSFEESKNKRNIHSNYLDMLEYAVNNAEVYTDKHTYQEEYYSTNYINSVHSFGCLLDSLCVTERRNHIHIEENDMRNYSDTRYSQHFLSPDWFSVNDIAWNMNTFMEKPIENQDTNTFYDSILLDCENALRQINRLKESQYYLIIGISIVIEVLLLWGYIKLFVLLRNKTSKSVPI